MALLKQIETTTTWSIAFGGCVVKPQPAFRGLVMLKPQAQNEVGVQFDFQLKPRKRSAGYPSTIAANHFFVLPLMATP